MNCPSCNGPMRFLFTSSYCENDCGRPIQPFIIEFFGTRWEVSSVEEVGIGCRGLCFWTNPQGSNDSTATVWEFMKSPGPLMEKLYPDQREKGPGWVRYLVDEGKPQSRSRMEKLFPKNGRCYMFQFRKLS